MNGLLVRRAEGTEDWKNIGDYIQSLAQEQFWDHIDLIVDREHLDTTVSPVPGERINLIMNSWWMWHPESFPPGKDINPLFVSFHISPRAAEKMLSETGVSYLQRYQPIGARDYGTMRILESHGIESYFSGCLTLTLGREYHYEGPRTQVYFVDPEYHGFKPKAFGEWAAAIFNLIRWRKKLKRLAPKFVFAKETVFSKISGRLNKLICLTLFYDQYREHFRDDLLFEAEFISHAVDVIKDFPTNEACLEHARSLLNKYSRARLVVTSRIHAALPSLGMETPVIFINSKAIDSGTVSGRLDGLTDFFNYRLEVTEKGLQPGTVDMAKLLEKGSVSGNSLLQNSKTYVPYRDALIEKVQAFVKSCSID